MFSLGVSIGSMQRSLFLALCPFFIESRKQCILSEIPLVFYISIFCRDMRGPWITRRQWLILCSVPASYYVHFRLLLSAYSIAAYYIH